MNLRMLAVLASVLVALAVLGTHLTIANSGTHRALAGTTLPNALGGDSPYHG
jgi:hypothetical protein